jgi:hypothetical protein
MLFIFQAKLKNSLIRFKVRTINSWNIGRDVLTSKLRYRRQLNPSDFFEIGSEKRRIGRDVLALEMRY